MYPVIDRRGLKFQYIRRILCHDDAVVFIQIEHSFFCLQSSQSKTPSARQPFWDGYGSDTDGVNLPNEFSHLGGGGIKKDCGSVRGRSLKEGAVIYFPAFAVSSTW